MSRLTIGKPGSPHRAANLLLRDPNAVRPTKENVRLVESEIRRLEARAALLRRGLQELKNRV